MEIGGVEKSLLDFLTHLSPETYELYLLLVEGAKGAYMSQIPEYIHVATLNSEKLEGPFYKIFRETIRNRNWFGARFKFAQLLSRFIGMRAYSILHKDVFKGIKFDISIGFKPDHCTYISTFAVKARKHFTWWHHGDFTVNRKRYLKLCNANDNVISVSDGVKNLLVSVGVKESLISVVPNMVDVNLISLKAFQSSPNYPKDRINIVSVSRLAPEKQFDLIPSLAFELRCRFKERFLWHIIGDGTMRANIEKEIEKYSVQDCVILHGNIPNPYPYILEADLFVHPSKTESQGLTVLEALSLGIPVVVGDTLGTREYIKSGLNGLMVKPNVQELSEAVIKILKSEEFYQKLKSQSHVPTCYYPDSVISKFESLIS